VPATVGDRLQEHPFYYNIYALKPGANGMHPAAGAILSLNSSKKSWNISKEAPRKSSLQARAG
jgi:hypothetical protein